MLEHHLIDQLKAVSLSMFRKNFLGIHHGSLSAKIQSDTFVINKADAIFDELGDKDFIELMREKNYRWNDASLDSDIHLNIYSNISEAKYVCYAMPPYITALSLKQTTLNPKDYFGSTILGELEVYDPKDFSSWYDRAKDEIYQYFRSSGKHIMIIKGYGIYTYNRDLQTLVKDIAILENSAKVLHYSN